MKYSLLKYNSHYSTTYRVTSHLNTTRLTHFHIIHVLKNQNTISLNQSISINTQALCNKYTKTQSYMQCGIMSVKKPRRAPINTNKTDHTLVSEVNLTR